MKLSMVIPFYNEEENARFVIADLTSILEKNKIDYEIIAVNNGSTDRTESILHEIKNNRIKIVKIENNIGFGYGVIKGLEAATGNYVGYMWGDGQIPASTVAVLFKKIQKENFDICKIRRSARDYSIFRKLESGAYNWIIARLFFGNITKDMNGSPKIMKRSLYEKLNIKSHDWFIDTEVMVKCRYLNAAIGEVKAAYLKREKGKSKVKFTVMFEFLKNIIRFRFWGLKNFK